MSLASKIDKYLLSIGIYISIEFTKQCLEYMEQELQGDFKKKSEKQIQEMLYNIFLNENLSEMGRDEEINKHPLANLDKIHNKRIAGPVVLQVNSLLDISIPMEEQLDLDNTDLLNDEDEEAEVDDQFHENMKKYDPNANKKKGFGQTAQRMIKLNCTDGINQVVEAIEYRPIHSLQLSLTPGTKVVVRNVLVRRGLLLLEPGGFNILGGEVRELINEANRNKLKLIAQLTGKPLQIKDEAKNEQEEVEPIGQNFILDDIEEFDTKDIPSDILDIEQLDDVVVEEPRKRLRLIKKKS
ncbi:RecQ-mediated genome instability protein [Acrasis kona]|uniref:RecQ-mediated genome instability protein 1 n=1 Tax=Acrasis kona TaxID=1008807 RepID=A0AAW2ZL94_9EUKA